jgi:hypothetical protein
METTAQRCTRLLGAMEDLLAQEAASLAAGDMDAVIALQQRIEPLVQDLGRRGPAVADDCLRDRVAAWLGRRREVSNLLTARVEELRQQISQLDASRRRVARVGPAYTQVGVSAQRLRLVG